MKTTTRAARPQIRKGGLALTCRPGDPHTVTAVIVRLERFVRAKSVWIDGRQWRADTPQPGWVVVTLGSKFVLEDEFGDRAVYLPRWLIPLDAPGVEDEQADEAPKKVHRSKPALA